MNCKKPKTQNFLNKALKGLTVICVLTLGFIVFFHSKNTSSQLLSIDCATLGSGVTAEPGLNCLFSSGSTILPLCNSVPSASYTINSANILSGAAPSPRNNCMDLKDLPLCDVISGGVAGKNCVDKCSDISTFTGIRGQDYAINNKDCVRLCSENASEGITTTNCELEKCNQLTLGIKPVTESPNNCNLIPCNMLFVDELIDVATKINNDDSLSPDDKNLEVRGNYCNGENNIDGNPLKCYHFSEAQLPYTVSHTMCKIHNCEPACSSYTTIEDVNGDGTVDSTNPLSSNRDTNDTLNILNHISGSTTYTNIYETYINNGISVGPGDTSLCNKILCKPVVNRQYSCLNSNGDISSDSSSNTNTNPNCDQTGPGAVCSSAHLCYKVIDCNNEALNGNEPECRTYDEALGSTSADDSDSWFYRPRPLDKATEGNQIRSPMDSALCYGTSQLRNNSSPGEPGYWGDDLKHTITIGGVRIVLDLGYAHSYLAPDATRSPGHCYASRTGGRGNGYIYLCYGSGPNTGSGQLYAKVADHTAYYNGAVTTRFADGDARHKLKMCLRFRNALRPDDGNSETCGRRECGISCAFDLCKEQYCGQDVCRDLHISDNDEDECKMSDTMFNDDGSLQHNDGKGCSEVIDDYLRLRIQKYDNIICSFLDVKGQTAHEIDFFTNGSEKINDEFCISGDPIGDDGKCSGKNTNDDPSSAAKWRTISFTSGGHIPYIQGNQHASTGEWGYRNKDGKLILAQNCIRVPLRVPTERLYNLANESLSPKLFTPPIYISHAFINKDSGAISVPTLYQEYGNTDFNYPEIEVRFGSTIAKLGLDLNYTGYEAAEGNPADPDGSMTIATTVNTINYSADIFVRKEYDLGGTQPIFCLYRKLQALDGTDLDPVRIQCVDRNFPELDNAEARAIDPSILPKKLVIYGDAANTFNNSSIILRYLGGFGANTLDDNCSNLADDICSSEIKLNNQNQSTPTCSSSVESYKACAQREECSKLNNECMQNEIDMQTAKIAGDSIDSFLLIRSECNNILLPRCNKKKGVSTTKSIITDPTVTPHINAYGWFNEICLVAGVATNSFDHELRNVVAHNPSSIPGAVMGKCVIAANSPSSNCPDGGKAPNCKCLEYDPNVAISPAHTVRLETRREAGLCVDMPLPQTCGAIINNPIPSNNPSDPDYVYSSLNGVDSSSVHTSHSTRTNAVGHAEFPIAILGMNAVEGSCKGFWKNATTGGGSTLHPTRDCLNNSGNGVWSNSVTNACVRYSCPQISTSDPDLNGNYQGNYGVIESGENKGRSNGFALWARYTKINDFLESRNAAGCLTGFKNIGASPISSNSVITSYSGGTPPSRDCNQLGQWQNTTNACERITCPAINPPSTPSSFTDWAEWTDSGGARFGSINASRSTSFIATGSIQTGTCETSLGYVQAPGSLPPTRECDHLGNWLPVQNACTTTCDAITLPAAEGLNNGYSLWSVTNVSAGTEIEATSTACVPGYKPYPYPSLYNEDGYKFTASGTIFTADDLIDPDGIKDPGGYTSMFLTDTTSPNYDSIPMTLANDSRLASFTAQLPKRMCKSVAVGSTISDFWFAPSSTCTNVCPGYNTDPRFGVGRTKHSVRSGEVIIEWPDTSFTNGEKWIYASDQNYHSGSAQGMPSNTPYFGTTNGSHYSNGRTNGKFMVARKCNTDGSWSDPIPQCVTNGGTIANSFASYSTTRISDSNSETMDVGGGNIASTSSCNAGPYFQSGADSGSFQIIPAYTETIPRPARLGGDIIKQIPEQTIITDPTLQPISRYTCEYKDSNNKIDETYFQKVDGDDCKVFCSIGVNEMIGNAHNPNPIPILKSSGSSDRVELNCNSGYGRIKDNESETDTNGSYDSNCGRRSYSRAGSEYNPYVTCNANASGNWNSLQNPCDKCDDCTPATDAQKLLETVADENNPGQRNKFIYSKTSNVLIRPFCEMDCSGTSEDDCFIAGEWNRQQTTNDSQGRTGSDYVCGNKSDRKTRLFPSSTLITSGTSEVSSQADGHCDHAIFTFQCLDGYYFVSNKNCW